MNSAGDADANNDYVSSSSVMDGENNDLIKALGMTKVGKIDEGGGEEMMTENVYDVVPNPNSEKVDLSELRGVASSEKKQPNEIDIDSYTELENLAELVPDVKARRRPTMGDDEDFEKPRRRSTNGDGEDVEKQDNSAKVLLDGGGGNDVEVVPVESDGVTGVKDNKKGRKMSMKSCVSTDARRNSMKSNTKDEQVDRADSLKVQESGELEGKKPNKYGGYTHQGAYDNIGIQNQDDSYTDNYPDSDHALEDDENGGDDSKIPSEFMNIGSSAQSMSTATQTHEVRMPMYLPTFKPATGCTNASDFIVRCFVARLRSGITVVKHGRSRWCKSRLRILHIHPDGRSLSWKPAEGEPTSSKRPPKLDLSTCLEVRHAWSPDPQNPMYTGTPILRQKCEAANAHKSFALIFKQRTVDITAVTADQCKVLMEGFSALCFRLQVANLAGRGDAKKGAHARPMPEEDGVSTTASATLTNTSAPRFR